MERRMSISPTVGESFLHCERIAKEHYENFPVASLAVPRNLRPYVWTVYAFARAADDFADEGTGSPAERLRALDSWERQLDDALAGRPGGPVFVALAETVARTSIPVQLLRDLLTAFRMDVTRSRHQTFDDLLGYCRCSANPVGRLVLHLFGAASAATVDRSDDLCTALQLTNFWQDIAVDLQKDRIYLPLDDLRRFGYTETDLRSSAMDARFRGLMKFQVARTRALFLRGRPLLGMVRGRLRFELDLTWRGGVAILDAIERSRYDVFRSRPVVGRADRLRILAAAIVSGRI
jgi:hydroxysqualene synthase